MPNVAIPQRVNQSYIGITMYKLTLSQLETAHTIPRAYLKARMFKTLLAREGVFLSRVQVIKS